MNNPWSQISRPSMGRMSSLRVNIQTVFDLFWIRDDNDQPGLLIEIAKDISEQSLKKARINIRDIKIDLVQLDDPEKRALKILLENQSSIDIFYKFCEDLVDRIKGGNKDQDTFDEACRRLKQWQSLFALKSRSGLSRSEIQGMYSELYFLAEQLELNSDLERLLIVGWEGPERTPHDFILNDLAVEVKSVAGNERGKVRISSEDQLDTHLERLYLQVFFLSILEEGSNGESLNDIVERITKQLTSSENRNIFEQKLRAVGYIDIQDYDSPIFRVKDSITYLVTDAFPRITRDNLPNGITAVSYDLQLNSIDNFRTTMNIEE